MRKNTISVALTGGIGCGKSFVLQVFAGCGATVVSADELARNIRRRPEVADRMADILGRDVLLTDGSGIDAARAADKIFNDPEIKRTIEELIHPLIRKEIKELVESISKEAGKHVFVAEVPLLFESSWEDEFDCSVAVWSNSSVIPQRMMERKWSDEEYSRRANLQLTPEEKLQRAKYGIINNGSAESVAKQCAELMNIWTIMED